MLFSTNFGTEFTPESSGALKSILKNYSLTNICNVLLGLPVPFRDILFAD